MGLLLLFRPRAAAGGGPQDCGDLLAEDGGFLLAEDGGHFRTEQCPDITPSVGGRRYRPAPTPIPFPLNDDEDILVLIQTHRPDPLRRR